MFPLGSVLLPGATLPLHIFEPRYRELTKDCLAGDQEFGVVLIARGQEVGGGEVRTNLGTVARIVAAREEPDGRWYLMAIGTRRFRVSNWLADDPYPRAEIEPMDDNVSDAMPSEEDYQALLSQTRRVLALASEVGVPAAELTSDFADDPRLGTFQVAAFAPLGAMDRQKVLGTQGADERTVLLRAMLDDVTVLLGAYLAPPGDRADPAGE